MAMMTIHVSHSVEIVVIAVVLWVTMLFAFRRITRN